MACEAFLHHTLSRTNEGHDIFVDDDHRYQFLTTLGQMMDRLADYRWSSYNVSLR